MPYNESKLTDAELIADYRLFRDRAENNIKRGGSAEAAQAAATAMLAVGTIITNRGREI